MKMKREAVKACRLRAADILLVHTKRSLWGWLIRWGTRCYWNHALMVCSRGDIEQGYADTFVVDARTSGSIVMGRASEYLERFDKYDVAVKRFEAGWFQNDHQGVSLDCCSHICNIAKNEVDFRLGSRLLELTDQIIRELTLIFRFIRRKLRGVPTPPALPWNIRPAQVKAFTCGGFVQWCYYKGMSRVIEEKGADQRRLKEVIFNPRVKKEATPFELLTTTPADLARCEKLSWKYLIKDGIIREVSGGEEAMLPA